MGLITLNLKRVLNWNYIFMSAVAAIFGMIFLMNFGDISENIVFGVIPFPERKILSCAP